jgi:type II secretion system protein H
MLRSRKGFTLIEMLVVAILMAIALGFAAAPIGRTLARLRVERAATVVASDLRLAPSLAARQKAAVRMSVNTTDRTYTLTDRASGAVLVTRHLAVGSEGQINTLLATPSQVDFYPNGIASDSMRLTLRAAGHQRIVRMTRAGQVRIVQ